jgi:hypothetical protein
MYYGQMELSLLSLAWKVGLHPSTFARSSSITSNSSKQLPIGPLKYLEDYNLHIIFIN